MVLAENKGKESFGDFLAEKGKTAEELAGKMRDNSIAEFFEKNRHLLGFDNPAKALLMVVKEAVDNSLDATQDARILPEIKVGVKLPREVFRILLEDGTEFGRVIIENGNTVLVVGEERAKPTEVKERDRERVFLFTVGEINYKFKIHRNEKEDAYEFIRGRTELKVNKIPADRFIVSIEDNGPGIVKENIPKVFGKLLYGSKFAGGKQGRGQQGIGISAALLYAQLTTGKPARIWSRTSDKKPVYYYELRIDTTKNEPIILEEKALKEGIKDHGVRVELEIEGKHMQRFHSVEEYLKQTVVVNPFAKITYTDPEGNTMIIDRVVNELPVEPKPLKPHPHGVEMGMLERMAKLTISRTTSGFLTNDFCRVGPQTAEQVCRLAGIKPSSNPHELDHEKIEKLWRTIKGFNFMKPPLDCLSPITEEKFLEGMKKMYNAEFIETVSRPPAVYRGNPFQIEVAIAYGGELPHNEQAKILRFANRVPLLYQASSCATVKAIQKIDWRHYAIDTQGSLPFGPVVIAVHMASVWIPYVSEAKEAIDPYPEIVKEMRLALQEAARKLQRFLSGRRRALEKRERQSLFEKYIPEAAEALAKLSDGDGGKIKASLEKMLKKGNIIIETQEEDVKAPEENTEEAEKETEG